MNFKMYLKTVLMTAVAVIGLSACDDNDDEQPLAPPPSEEALTFKVSVEPGIEGSLTTVSIRPSTEDVEYYANVWSKEKVGAVSGSELTKMILEAEDRADRTYWGEELLSFENLTAGTYYVVIMGVEDNKAVDKPKKKPFMVKEKEPATLTLTREEVTSSSVGYTVTPSDPNETYIVSAILKSEFDEYETTTAFMGSDVDYWKENGGLAAMLKKGEYSATIPGLEENTEYVLYAYFCDAEGMVTTGLVTSVFTTKTSQPTPPPPATDTPTLNPFINMVAATTYWPDKADPTDVGLEVSLNASADAAHTSFSFVNEGVTDEQAIELLLQGAQGVQGVYYDQDKVAVGILAQGTPVIFVGIAIDASGNVGPLVRLEGTAEIGNTLGDPNPPTPPSGDGPKVSAEFKWVDAATIDPSYAGLFALEVKLTTDGAHTYSACFQPQAADATDSQIIAALTSGGDGVSFDPQDGMELWRTFTPGEEALYAVVATDAAGKPGPLLRQMLVAGEDIDDPNPPTPSGDYAKYLGNWTLTAKGTYTDPQSGAVTKVEDVTYNLTIEQNEAGSSYKVWGLTNYNELDVVYNAPAIWKFSNGKLQIVQSWDLGECSISDFDRLAFFGKFKSAAGELAYFSTEGLVLAEATLASDNETLELEWGKVTSSDDKEFTCFDWIYGLGQSEGNRLSYFPGFDPAKENIVIKKAAEEQPSDAYKAYLGNWTLTGQDYNSADVTFNFTISQKRANKSYTVTGWSGPVGTEYPCEMKFNAADGSVSLYEQGNLGTYSDASASGTIITAGMILDPADNQYYFWGGTEEVLTGKISGNNLTLTGKTISGTNNSGAPFSYDFIGYRYGCILVDGRVAIFDNNSWPLFPTTVVKGGTSAKTKGRARLTATFEKAPQMKLSSVLDAANVYASFDTRTAKVSRPTTILPVRLVSLGDSAKMPVAVLHEFATLNYTPCRK